MSAYTEYIFPQLPARSRKSSYLRELTTSASSQAANKTGVKTSFQQKFFLFCLLLIGLMAVSISTAYFVMTRREKQQESQQRIQVAFDMVLYDTVRQIDTFTNGFQEFLHDSAAIQGAAQMYAAQMTNVNFQAIYHSIALSYLLNVTDEMKKFAHLVSANRVVLYGADASILAMYQQDQHGETVGLSVLSEDGNQTYLSLDDYPAAAEMLAGRQPIPDRLFPDRVETHFYGAIPTNLTVKFFSEGAKFGIRMIAPVYQLEKLVGVMTSDIFYSQAWIQQYATLTQTDINLFIGSQLSIGTLREYAQPLPEALSGVTPVTIATLLQRKRQAMPVRSVTLAGEQYYQGVYQLIDDLGPAYTLTVSVSKKIEAIALRNVLIVIVTISGIAVVLVFGLSIALSRRTMQALHHLVRVIGAAASGDLRQTAPVLSHDEFGVVALKLNEMIVRLRDLSHQTQAVSHSVTATATTMLGEVEHLFGLMEQQAVSVDSTTAAVEGIRQFIESVVANINRVLHITQEILNAIQHMSRNTEDVAGSTKHLTQNLHGISACIDDVSVASTSILQHVNRLLKTVQATDAEIVRIGESLLNVSQNAAQSKQLACETVNAALAGQRAAASSIEGMTALKQVVAQSAQIMHNVKTRTDHVSSILDIVDGIAEKTTLLSFNASIIAAQAGEEGRGFSVIANEIRELSAQTKTSTKQIGELIFSLQKEVVQGVKSVSAGIPKVDDGVDLVNAVKASLDVIIQRATASSERAGDTARVIEQTVKSSQKMQASMTALTTMTSHIQSEVEREEQRIEEIVAAIETIRVMSEQVKQANVAQHVAADQIEARMQSFIKHLSGISAQTQQLQGSADQIVAAMRQIDAVTEVIIKKTTVMSERTIASLVSRAGCLQEGLSVFLLD